MPSIAKQLLQAAPTSEVTLCHATDVPRYYWLIEYHGDRREAWRFAVSVNHQEIEPVFHIGRKRLFCGVEQGVFALDLETGAVTNAVTDASYVQWFEATPDGFVVVAAEDQVLTFDEGGSLIWRTNLPEIISDLVIDGRRIRIVDLEGGDYEHDLFTGTRLK